MDGQEISRRYTNKWQKLVATCYKVQIKLHSLTSYQWQVVSNVKVLQTVHTHSTNNYNIMIQVNKINIALV